MELQKRLDSSLDGSCNSLLPEGIHDWMRPCQIDVGRDVFMMCAEHDKDGLQSGFASDSNGAGEQGFARNADQLLGLAEAAAGSCGEDNSWHGH